MKICHVCKAECTDDMELCPVCGAELKSDTDENPVIEETIIENPVLVASVEDVVSAEIYKDILSENCIPFTCNQDDSDASMKVVFGGGFVADDIYVDEQNFEKAQKLYDDFLNAEPEFSDEDFEAFDTEEAEDGESL